MTAAIRAERFLVFTVGAGTYAIAAERVRACVSLPRLTPLDDTAPWVVGAFDLHGELAPVVSVPALLGMAVPAAGRGDLVIVTAVDGHPVGIHADAVLGIEPALSIGTARRGRPATAQGAVEREVMLFGGRARVLNPARLTLAAEPDQAVAPADTRLATFERDLDGDGLAALEWRAYRYSGLVSATEGPPAASRPAG